MPTSLDIDDTDIDDDDLDPNADAANLPQNLRRAARDGKKARAEATRLARENVLLKAGIDTDSPLGKMFAAGYDGELTKDAVSAAWKALGVTAASDATADDPPADDTAPDPAEAASTAERQALANGATPDVPPVVDSKQASIDKAHAVIKAGGSTEHGIAAMFDARVEAAVAGDKRVLANQG